MLLMLVSAELRSKPGLACSAEYSIILPMVASSSKAAAAGLMVMMNCHSGHLLKFDPPARHRARSELMNTAYLHTVPKAAICIPCWGHCQIFVEPELLK